MLTPGRRHARALRKVKRAAGLVAAGPPRPSTPISTFAEDFSLLVRFPRRLRVKRGRITVLN